MHALLAALRNSLRGFLVAARGERAVRQELGLIVLSVPLALLVSEHLWVRVALVGVLLVVLAVELLNTAIEALADHVTPERHPQIGLVKDFGSSAVLCALVLAGLLWGAALVERMGWL